MMAVWGHPFPSNFLPFPSNFHFHSIYFHFHFHSIYSHFHFHFHFHSIYQSGHVVSAHAYTQRHEFSVAPSRSGLGVAVSRELYWDPRMLPSVSRDEIIRMLFHEGYSNHCVFGGCVWYLYLDKNTEAKLKKAGFEEKRRR